MSKALKKVDKKYLFVIGGIFVVIFLIIGIVALFRACTGPGNNYEKTENKMKNAAASYFTSEGQSLPDETESKEVSTNELSSAGFMKELSEYLVDVSCSGKVTVYNHGGQMLYVPDLDCSEYKTKHLVDKIKEDSLIENTDDPYKSGLYSIDDKFVFRGKTPNNYLTFGGISWRIIDISSDGLIRVIKSDPEKRSIAWDTKFNSEVNKTYGINDYKNSYILEKMNEDYAGFKDESKKHLAPHSVCVGKRASQDLGIDYNIDCAETLDKQYISVINASDYGRASLDSECKSVLSGSCVNYNYMTTITTDTWTSTAMNTNTYDVINISGGVASTMNARKTASYNWVIAFEGSEKYISGDGTEKNPYVIGTSSKK